MLEKVLKWSFKIVFSIFVLSLIFTVAYGLYLVWIPSGFSETAVRTIASSVIIVWASLFFTAVCDVWFRIVAGK